MKLYAVRMLEEHQAVGLYWCRSAEELNFLVDEMLNSWECEYKIINKPCAFVWPFTTHVNMGDAVHFVDIDEDGGQSIEEHLDKVTGDMRFGSFELFHDDDPLHDLFGRVTVGGWTAFDREAYDTMKALEAEQQTTTEKEARERSAGPGDVIPFRPKENDDVDEPPHMTITFREDATTLAEALGRAAAEAEWADRRRALDEIKQGVNKLVADVDAVEQEIIAHFDQSLASGKITQAQYDAKVSKLKGDE